jgi:hypothetical protein
LRLRAIASSPAASSSQPPPPPLPPVPRPPPPPPASSVSKGSVFSASSTPLTSAELRSKSSFRICAPVVLRMAAIEPQFRGKLFSNSSLFTTRIHVL